MSARGIWLPEETCFQRSETRRVINHLPILQVLIPLLGAPLCLLIRSPRVVGLFALFISILVFYVLAMQCLPTQAVTRRETNSWKWPLFQLGYMTVLAYVAAFVAFRLASLFV